MTILITAASTSYPYKLEKELGESSIVFADSVELPEIMLKNKKFIKIPPASSDSFAHSMLSICLDNNIDKVFPMRQAELKALAESRQLFDEYGIKVMVPRKEHIESLLGPDKTGKIFIKETESDGDDPSLSADRGAFLYRPESKAKFQLLTVD